jgi:hypothetical protein
MREEKRQETAIRWQNEELYKKHCETMLIANQDKERCQKVSKSLKKFWEDPANRKRKGDLCPHRKKVMCIETGIIYCSAQEAADAFSVSKLTIKNTIRGKYPPKNGYHFKYID